MELILGGARSGKSRYAAEQAGKTGLPVTMVATAEALDGEMAERIARHRRDRPAHWTTVEEPLALAEVLVGLAGKRQAVIVDCLTLWLANHLGHGDEGGYGEARRALLEILPGYPNPLYLVSNEIGLGVVAMEALTRRFVDEAGWLHQELGRISPRVTLMVAGCPVCVKGERP